MLRKIFLVIGFFIGTSAIANAAVDNYLAREAKWRHMAALCSESGSLEKKLANQFHSGGAQANTVVYQKLDAQKEKTKLFCADADAAREEAWNLLRAIFLVYYGLGNTRYYHYSQSFQPPLYVGVPDSDALDPFKTMVNNLGDFIDKNPENSIDSSEYSGPNFSNAVTKMKGAGIDMFVQSFIANLDPTGKDLLLGNQCNAFSASDDHVSAIIKSFKWDADYVINRAHACTYKVSQFTYKDHHYDTFSGARISDN